MGAHPIPPVHGPLAPGIHIFRFLPLLLGTQFYISLGRFCVPQAFPPTQDALSYALFSLIEVYFIYSVSGLPQSDSFYMYFLRFFSIVGYYKILGIVPCTTQ